MKKPIIYPSLVLLSLTAAVGAGAATIQFGDVTSGLTGTLYVDEAATGGGDFTLHDDGGTNGDGRASVGIRPFDYGNVPGTITITGFGFATSAATAANDATSINLEFYYLGADGEADIVDDPEPDDVLIGIVENITYAHVDAGEYYVNFGEESVSAQIDGANNLFRVWMKVNNVDAGLQESIRFKTTTGVGSKISVAGSFEAGAADPTWAGYPIRPDGYVDTTPFLGWIWVGDPMAPSDWIWSVSLSNYVYMPESLVNPESGGWAYVPRF